jgi:hypothetical protein
LTLGRLHRHKHRGIAKLKVSVPGSGLLLLRGKTARAVTCAVGGAGTLTLVVRPKPEQMKTLKRRGHLKVG